MVNVIASVQAALGPQHKKLEKEVPNFTDIKPIIQVSGVVRSQPSRHPDHQFSAYTSAGQLGEGLRSFLERELGCDGDLQPGFQPAP